MSIALLRTLVAISEHGSFSAAADAVNLTQAAVGQQMKRLEAQLDASLFDRDTGVPKLNPLALSLVPKASELITAYDNLLIEFAGESPLTGEFSLGAVPSTIRALVPQCLTRLRERAPLVRVRVVPGLSVDIHEQVERGGVDAAILSQPAHVGPKLHWQPFAREPLVLLASAELKSNDALQLLQEMPYIRHTRRADVGLMADEWLSDHGVTVQAAMEMESLESVASMVSHNLGVSIVPDVCVPDVVFDSLRRLPLPPPAKARCLGLLSRVDVRKKMLIDVLFEELCETVRPKAK